MSTNKDATNPYRIVVMASDKYLDALRPFAYLMNRHWNPNPDVVIAGFSEPPFELPKNFSFISLGSFSDYPFKRWSDALLKMMDIIPDEVFILMLEDYWIIRDVDTRAVQILVDYAYQFEYVAKIDLCGDRLYAHGADTSYGYVGHIDLVKSMPGSPYHLSLMTGIWRKEHLRSSVIPGESPHDVELVGTTRLSHNQNVIVVGTRQWPVRHTLGLRGGDPNSVLVEDIDKTELEEMKSLGYFKRWNI